MVLVWAYTMCLISWSALSSQWNNFNNDAMVIYALHFSCSSSDLKWIFINLSFYFYVTQVAEEQIESFRELH